MLPRKFESELLLWSNNLTREFLVTWEFFYIFCLYFAKINGPLEILQNYTSAAVTHGGKSPATT
jgi:hypothetical protein